MMQTRYWECVVEHALILISYWYILRICSLAYFNLMLEPEVVYVIAPTIIIFRQLMP